MCFGSPHSSIPLLLPGPVCCAQRGKTGKTGHWQQQEPVQGREVLPISWGLPGGSDATVMGTRETGLGCEGGAWILLLPGSSLPMPAPAPSVTEPLQTGRASGKPC